MLSLQGDPRQHHHHLQHHQQLQLAPYSADHREDSLATTAASSSVANLKRSQALDSHEVDEGMLMALAHQMYKAGNFKQALEQSTSVYDRNPQRTDNLLLLGAIHYQLHDFDMCIAKNEEALQIDPHFAECYGNMANAWKEKGNIDFAIRYYLIAIELRPNFADAWSNLASAYMRKGRFNEAAQCCRQALALNPRLVDAHSNLGNLMKAQGLVQEAYNCYVEAIRLQPNFAIAWSNLAGLFMEANDLNRALQYYKLKGNQPFSDAYLNLGNVYKALGMPQEAIVCYQRALQVRPDYVVAYVWRRSVDSMLDTIASVVNSVENFMEVQQETYFWTLALMLKMKWECGNYADAISCYNEVLRIDPLAADGLVNRGNTYKEIGRVNEAIHDYTRAINIRPAMAEAHANLASAYKDRLIDLNSRLTLHSGHVEGAIKSYKQALLLRPEFPEATCNLLHTLQCVCDWEDRDGKFMEVEGILRRQIKMAVIPSVQPFHAIAYPIDPMLALEISRKYAAHCSIIASRYSVPPFNYPAPLSIKGEGGSGRLRVGYVSSDFGNHPLSHLMGSVFGMHDRENVEVFCYALSPNDGTEWRQRIQSEAEHFIDVSSMSSDMIARLINEDRIQILVNLNGYTKGARNEIFAMQPAPIQISYMGFPGTTGASYIHYLVTDEFVSPSRFSHIYSEKLVHLPHCYFVNDYKQKNCDVLDQNCQPKRSDYGLPEDKFIFACFNQLYKMDPDIFNAWCNILKRVPNSALWLLRFPAAGEMRLRAYAAQHGVQSDQIIFTDVAMKNEHIRRSALADLFLDTPLCNAHTTGTDVLWAGLPMVTLPLEKMATRVAGSLCLATGIGEEMIVYSTKEYEEKAVSLALNRPKLQDLTARLKAARMTCPLFDTARWVRNLERAYFKMWNLYCCGQHPQPFKVAENDVEFPYDS
ncbi:putative UDP-N-acetylglucosamine--peptide N-acetylglucosaminyltransferase SEC [Morella rubra]|uniref:protein O-GlcNAc transferase n=1 Tax=Morella rubra TaxID=262757 RepID=A0A6A1VL82_9ROSI|nr:putative UDP-N-acetylglucosamine--peptide N-acetylglucosaminyltransferase SEC [Morella rubra]